MKYLIVGLGNIGPERRALLDAKRKHSIGECVGSGR